MIQSTVEKRTQGVSNNESYLPCGSSSVLKLGSSTIEAEDDGAKALGRWDGKKRRKDV